MNNPEKIRKRPPLWILTVALGLAAFALGWWLSGMDRHDHAAPAVTATAVVAAPAGGGAQQMYTCSMHPQVRSSNPNDKCPICGMALIPVPMDKTEKDEGGPPRLRLTARAAALMQIAVWPVETRPVHRQVKVFGRIGYDETRLRTIAAWMPGRLDRLYVDFTGTEVRQGDPMVDIYSPTLMTAQEEHLQAIQTARELEGSGIASVRDATRMTVAASHDRLRLLGLDSEQIQRLESRGRVDERLVIPAPVGGVVIERLAATGDYVQTGQPIYRLADLSHLWAAIEVYESDIQWLQLGQKAILVTESHPGDRVEGRITFIDPILNERNRTVGVRVDLPNPDGRLKPGMFVRGEIEAGPGPAGTGKRPPGGAGDRTLVIPATAPLITGERALVYVQLRGEKQPTFEPRDILLGPRTGDWYIVREGLAEGELVVTNGAFKIDSELQIRGRPSLMQPKAGPPPPGDAPRAAAGPAPAAPRPQPAAPRPEPARVSAPRAFQAQVGRLVQVNFALVKALAADDPEAARRAAMQFDEALHAVDPARLTSNAQRRDWNRLSKTLHDTVLGVAAGADLNEKRRHFKPFSTALIELVHAFGVAEAGPVYRAMCPMVEGGQGFWLQPQKAITNPYFGAMMLTCGEILETIAAAGNPPGGDR
jgi:Cu(I)/Ag(I) efflux system membrane fusion protein